MSVRISSACWPVRGLSLKGKFVLMALAEHADDAGVCWPSINRLSDYTGADVRTVRRGIAELEEAGHLIVDRSNGRHSHYIVRPKPRAESPHPGQSDPGSIAATEGSVSPTPVSVTGDPGQAVHEPRAESPPNHQRTVIESSVKQPPQTPVVVDEEKQKREKNGKTIDYRMSAAIREKTKSWSNVRLEERHADFVRWLNLETTRGPADLDHAFLQAIRMDRAKLGVVYDTAEWQRDVAADNARRAAAAQELADAERERIAFALDNMPEEHRVATKGNWREIIDSKRPEAYARRLAEANAAEGDK